MVEKVCSSVLQNLLCSFKNYYNIKTDSVADPFIAEAEFHSHEEQYFLVRPAKLSDIDSAEYIFFAEESLLSLQRLAELDSLAWESGLSRVKPYYGHRNTDVSLIVVTDGFCADEKEFARTVRKTKHYKSYKWSLYGWSNYRLAVYDVKSGKVYTNSFGTSLKKVFANNQALLQKQYLS